MNAIVIPAYAYGADTSGLSDHGSASFWALDIQMDSDHCSKAFSFVLILSSLEPIVL